ncbi:ABC transporter transmembrane domain-containing protein, partial [uncultured Bacteroides sp.]
MICSYYKASYPLKYIESLCNTYIDGISLLSLEDMASKLNFKTECLKVSVKELDNFKRPVILHWNQNHFVILYSIRKGIYHIADPGKGLIKYSKSDFLSKWASAKESGNEYGIVLDLYPSAGFSKKQFKDEDSTKHTIKFISKYLNRFGKHLAIIGSGLLVGCLLQLIFPFLTQSIVDVGIKHNDLNFIWLILLGELMIVTGRTATDFIRRWLLLHISMRINISLISDFFIKLLKLPMSFFDTKLMGDLLQRISDHTRVQSFLTNQTLSVLFTSLSFVVFGIVLLIYNRDIFTIFIIGTCLYTFWISSFLRKRKAIDYQLFEQQAINQNRTYQFITYMQEIKLQDCEQRRRWEWEDTQSDLFEVQMKSLKLQQSQEAGSIFINEVKNILITAFAATAVIDGQITLGAMLAIQYIV